MAAAARARHVLLGETHDNAEHHRLQRVVLEALGAQGSRALAMEQFDTEHQPAMDAARTRGADAEALADAGRLNRKGWDWPRYRPLVEYALERGWPILAANLSREAARAIVADPSRFVGPPPGDTQRRILEKDMVDGHCGQQVPPQRLAGMVAAQRARDARMAETLSRQPASVLIAGSHHVRREIGVPAYLGGTLSIAFIETRAGASRPQDYRHGEFDYLWFTAPAARKDPCEGFATRS
jgi:uncharacterized iron-regulated protein